LAVVESHEGAKPKKHELGQGQGQGTEEGQPNATLDALKTPEQVRPRASLLIGFVPGRPET